MGAGYWTAMADILTFPNGCLSLCFTLNAQEAQEKEFFHRLSGQNFFLQRLWLLLLQVLMLRNWISHFQNPRPVYLFLKILWTNTKSMDSYHLRFWAHDAEIRWAVKDVLSHFSSRSNASMRSLFLSMFTDNAFVKEYSMSKDKVSYYVNYEIASVFRNEMLLTCVKC